MTSDDPDDPNVLVSVFPTALRFDGHEPAVIQHADMVSSIAVRMGRFLRAEDDSNIHASSEGFARVRMNCPILC